MTNLKEKLAEKIEQHRPRVRTLLKEHCDTVLDEVTVGKLIGGMRGLKCLVTDISYLDPEEGIRYRGLTLPEVFEQLPKPPDGEMPYVEGLYYLLLTGDIPNEEEMNEVLDEFRSRRILPRYVYEVIDAEFHKIEPWLTEVLDKSIRAAKHGAIRGIAKTGDKLLQQRGVSKQNAWLTSQIFYYGTVFTMRFNEHYVAMEDMQEETEKLINAAYQASVETAEIMVTNATLATIGRTAHWAGTKLYQHGWHTTGKITSWVGSMFGYGIYAYDTYYNPVQTVSAVASGIIAEKTVETVSDFAIARFLGSHRKALEPKTELRKSPKQVEPHHHDDHSAKLSL